MVHVNKLNHCVTQTQRHTQNHHSLLLIHIRAVALVDGFTLTQSVLKYLGDLKEKTK